MLESNLAQNRSLKNSRSMATTVTIMNRTNITNIRFLLIEIPLIRSMDLESF